MTDNLSVNVNLNSQSQSSNLIENVSPDSLPSSSEMSTEEKLLSMETPMSRLLANSGGVLENAETPNMTSLGLPPGSVLTATAASDTISPWGGGYQGSRSDNKLIDLAKIPLRVVGTAVTLGTYSTGLGGYEPVEFKERGDLRVQHDGDTGSTIIERLDPVDGKWKPEEGVAYRDFASETGGEAKFVVNDEVLTASTGGRPIHESAKDDYVDIKPYPNREDHDTTTPPYPIVEQDKNSHIQSNPLPGKKLPWRTETPAGRVDEPTVMLNEQPDNAKINGTSAEVSSIGNATDCERLQQLITEGHGVQRHGAQVTRDQLIDRAMYGKDPMTGSTVDGVHGGVHQYAQHATKVTSDPAYVRAENYARNSQQFIDATTSSTTGRAQVEIPLKDIFVDDFSGNVFGITREGPKNAPTGYTETIFDQDSSMIVRYKQNSTGDWVFNTMFPQPK